MHKDHQSKEDEVANLWYTWKSEIPTKLEKNGQRLLYGAMDEQVGWRTNELLELGEEEAVAF